MMSPTCVACSEPAPVDLPRRVGPAVVAGHCRQPTAAAALRAAIVLAGRLDAELHVLHSTTLDDYDLDPDSEHYEDERDRAVAQERADVLDVLRATDVVWAYHEQRGDPAAALAGLADEVDAAYLVVGATHPGMLRHLVGGASVARRLVEHQQRPVMIVPELRSRKDAHGQDLARGAGS